MTIFDNLENDGAPGIVIGLHRACGATALLKRCGVTRALVFALCRPRGPPLAN